MNTDSNKREFYIDDYDLTLTTSKYWREVNDETEYDLYITNGECYLGVMAYYMIDLIDDYTVEDVYEIQTQEILKNKKNTALVEPTETITCEGKTISATMYSGEYEKYKFYFYSFMVTFDDNPDVIAWISVTNTPSDMLKHKEDILNIIKTLEYKGDKLQGDDSNTVPDYLEKSL